MIGRSRNRNALAVRRPPAPVGTSRTRRPPGSEDAERPRSVTGSSSRGAGRRCQADTSSSYSSRPCGDRPAPVRTARSSVLRGVCRCRRTRPRRRGSRGSAASRRAGRRSGCRRVARAGCRRGSGLVPRRRRGRCRSCAEMSWWQHGAASTSPASHPTARASASSVAVSQACRASTTSGGSSSDDVADAAARGTSSRRPRPSRLGDLGVVSARLLLDVDTDQVRPGIRSRSQACAAKVR